MNNQDFKQLKYNKARLSLMKLIAESGLQVGDRLPPVRTLVESLPYGSVTITRALSDMKAEGLIDGRHGSGIYLKRELKDNVFGTHLLCVYVRKKGLPYFVVKTDQARTFLSDRGVGFRELFVYDFGLDILNEAKGAIGILVTGWLTEDFIRQMKSLGLPLLIMGNYEKKWEIPAVTIGYEKGVYFLTKLFLEKGFRKIAIIETVRTDYYTSVCHYNGYARAMKEYGLQETILEQDLFLDNDPAFLQRMEQLHPEVLMMETPWFYNYSAWSLDAEFSCRPEIGLFETPVCSLQRKANRVHWSAYRNLAMVSAELMLDHLASGKTLESYEIAPELDQRDGQALD